MILCSGNPKNQTIAQGINKLYPTAQFVGRSTGYDLTTPAGLELFEKNIVDYKVFINSSFIALGIQLNLLEIACRAWMKADVKGHIVSIGTTAEWTTDGRFPEYVKSKTDLRLRSLELNDQTGITGVKTTYIILGGLNDGKKGNEEYPTVSSVAKAIDWAIQCHNRIPLIQIESPK